MAPIATEMERQPIIPSPDDVNIPSSVVDELRLVEVVRGPDGRLIAEVTSDGAPRVWGPRGPGTHLRTVHGAVWRPMAGRPELAVVKRVLLGSAHSFGPRGAAARWGREVTVHDRTRRVSRTERSYVEEFDDELTARGMPGRIPRLLGYWIERRNTDLGDRAVLATEWLPGVPLRTLIERQFPDGLPTPLALEVSSQIAAFVDAAHHRGFCIGDLNSANTLVELGADGTVIVRLCDLEYLDVLNPGDDEEDRVRIATYVGSDHRHRLDAERLSTDPVRMDHHLTVLDICGRLGFDSDLGFLAVLTALAFTGCSDPDAAVPPGLNEVHPLTWLLRRAGATGPAYRDRRSGDAPEIASATAFARWLSLLVPRPEESHQRYVARIEAGWDDDAPSVMAAVLHWAKWSRETLLLLVAARWVQTVFRRVSGVLSPSELLGMPDGLLVQAMHETPDDTTFLAMLRAAGLDPEADRDLLAAIAAPLSPYTASDSLARLARLGVPVPAAPIVSGRPRPRADPAPWGTNDWYEQIVAHAPSIPGFNVAAPDRTYGIRFEDSPENDFRFIIIGGVLSAIERGTGHADATSTTTSADFADFLDGTTDFLASPPIDSGERALWAFRTVAPSSAIMREITEPSTWPSRDLSFDLKHPAFTDPWFDAFALAAKRQPTSFEATVGRYVVEVIDDANASFAFEIGLTGRIVALHTGVPEAPEERAKLRRRELLEVLTHRSLAAGNTHPALANLARTAPDIAEFTVPGPVTCEFWTPEWWLNWRAESGENPVAGVADATVVLVPSEDRRLPVSVTFESGRVTAIRAGSSQSADELMVPAGRLWDVLVVGWDWPGDPPDVIRVLVGNEPADPTSFTAPSPRLGVGPGEIERLQLAEARRVEQLRREHSRRLAAATVAPMIRRNTTTATTSAMAVKERVVALAARAAQVDANARTTVARMLDRIVFGPDAEVRPRGAPSTSDRPPE